jgi:D-glycero-alpha-D-manno-heptose-7-phosphate kinase
MKKVTVRAPVRADLAGGTLDLWPLYLFHPGARTVNVAISFYAESEVCELGDKGAIEIHLTDEQYEQRYESLQQLAADPKAALIHRALEHFHLTGIRITTRTDAPRGSGLGGSSALTVTLVHAISELLGNPVHGDALIDLVCDLETRLINVPAGIQDYFPPVYGGLAALHLNPGAVVRHEIPLPIEKLSDHMLLHYTGVAHFSGTNNWQIYKRQIDGKKKVQKGLDKIAQNAIEMEKALESGNMEAAGLALRHEWENRKALIDGVSTPEIDAAIAAATGAGAWAGKVCGAGGGGCVVFLMPPEKKDEVRSALSAVPGRVLDAVPVAHGLSVDRGDDDTLSSSRPRMARKVGTSLEQLYVYGGFGDYRPYVLAEAIVTLNEPRSGAHLATMKSYVAPIEGDEGNVAWASARPLDAAVLDVRAVPEPHRRINVNVPLESLAQSQDSFRQFVAETEKLAIWSNPTFAMYSQPGESREAFAARCREEAERRIDDETERLEGTFRRRIDQVKERSERDLRDDESTDDTASNFAWGQTIYNLTTGKPAAVAEAAPTSMREVDYLEKIAQIQRAWDRELETIREELMTKAREIEPIIIVPTAKNIEIAKYLILWAANLS